jgi:hypothetical protein
MLQRLMDYVSDVDGSLEQLQEAYPKMTAFERLAFFKTLHKKKVQEWMDLEELIRTRCEFRK